MKRENFEKITIVLIALSLLFGGGYFVSASAFLSMVLFLLLTIGIWKQRQLTIPMGIFPVSVFLMVLLYFLCGFWAIDKGMAPLGGVKFLPLILFGIWLVQEELDRKKVIDMLPLLGAGMTLISFVMMQFDVFKQYVSVSGRLAGFFQYPNTYAIFLLICLIILFEKFQMKDFDLYDAICVGVLAIGIFLSGSRTVFVLCIVTIFMIALLNKSKKELLISGCVLGIAVVAVGVWGDLNRSSLHIFDWSYLSTFWGRVLYYKDAMRILLKHPFGMGYYGYYFVQGEMQTGVYSVVNVHNEFLQLMLDIGIIPGMLFAIVAIHSVVKISNQYHRLALIILGLHTMLDYDFQFISMGMIALLFIENFKCKEYKVAPNARVLYTSLNAILIVGMSFTLLSDLFYITKDYKKSVEFYKGNTLAWIEQLNDSENQKEMNRLANKILKYNSHSAVAYDALALIEFSEGDTEGYVQYKLKSISLAKYDLNRYLEYMDTLFLAGTMYLESEDYDSATICYKRLKSVPDMLAAVEKQTDGLAWLIRDTPNLTCPEGYTRLINMMEGNLEKGEE